MDKQAEPQAAVREPPLPVSAGKILFALVELVRDDLVRMRIPDIQQQVVGDGFLTAVETAAGGIAQAHPNLVSLGSKSSTERAGVKSMLMYPHHRGRPLIINRKARSQASTGPNASCCHCSAVRSPQGKRNAAQGRVVLFGEGVGFPE